MNKQNGFTLVEMTVVLIIICGGLWLWNAAKLFSCDFAAPYRCEVVHGIGIVVPPLAPVAVWFGGDDD